MSNHRTRTLASISAVAAILLTAAPAAASGPPILPTAAHPVENVLSRIDNDPCTRARILLTGTETGVLHVTRFADGTVHFSVALHTSFVADLDPSGLRVLVGTYTVRGGGNGSLNTNGSAFDRAEASLTLNGEANRPDGTPIRFHQNTHTVFGADGLPDLDLAHAHCQ